MQYAIASIVDGDVEGLVDVLDTANRGRTPRVTKALLDSHIDNEDTDIDQLFDDVLNFLKKANATKKTTLELLERVEAEKAAAAAANQ